MTEPTRLDPFRRGLLADMGVDVWVLRDSRIGVVEEAATDAIVVPEASIETTVPASTPEIVAPAEAKPPLLPEAGDAGASPMPRAPSDADAPGAIAVTCLTQPGAVLLTHGRDWAKAGRLGRDLLAAATGNWGAEPRRISFDWREPGAPGDGWRAFKAFADKQLADAEASVIFVNETLVDQLPDGARERMLIVLPALAEFDMDAKRALWNRIRNHQR